MFYITQNFLELDHDNKTVGMIQQRISKHKTYTKAEKVFERFLKYNPNVSIQFYYDNGNFKNPHVLVIGVTETYRDNWKDLFTYHEKYNYKLQKAV